MNNRSALLLQAAMVLIGIGTIALLLWEPHLEGRNANATTFEIYFHDPFLAYVYLGSVPFFVALHRAFALFGHAGRIGAFSQATVDSLRTIKRCAFTLIGFVAGAAVIIIVYGEEWRAGIFMCLLATLGSSLIAIAAATFARKVENTLNRTEGSRA